MTEPPRPPGDGNYGTPSDPTAPFNATPPGNDPASGYPPPPAYGSPPPGSGAGGYPPPSSGAGGYPPPASGAPGYPPGGGTPPPYGYQQAPGYPAGAYGQPPAGFATADDKNWALIAHFGGAIGAFISFGPLGFVGPLIAYLVKGPQSPAVRAHALEALNFQVLWSIIALVLFTVSWCLLFIPSFIVFAIQIIFGIMAGVKANNGEPYKYPMSVSFIK
jgi:uncharacterized Tic20 family protein